MIDSANKTILPLCLPAEWIPLIDGWIRLRTRKEPSQPLLFIQDNARAHYAAATQQELEERGIQVIT